MDQMNQVRKILPKTTSFELSEKIPKSLNFNFFLVLYLVFSSLVGLISLGSPVDTSN